MRLLDKTTEECEKTTPTEYEKQKDLVPKQTDSIGNATSINVQGNFLDIIYSAWYEKYLFQFFRSSSDNNRTVFLFTR